MPYSVSPLLERPDAGAEPEEELGDLHARRLGVRKWPSSCRKIITIRAMTTITAQDRPSRPSDEDQREHQAGRAPRTPARDVSSAGSVARGGGGSLQQLGSARSSLDHPVARQPRRRRSTSMTTSTTPPWFHLAVEDLRDTSAIAIHGMSPSRNAVDGDLVGAVEPGRAPFRRPAGLVGQAQAREGSRSGARSRAGPASAQSMRAERLGEPVRVGRARSRSAGACRASRAARSWRRR